MKPVAPHRPPLPDRTPPGTGWRKRIEGLILTLVVVMAAAAPSGALSQTGAAAVGTATGLPVPRYVALRSGEVNVRTGPGVRYPVEWVFLRKEMPVEITAEFDTWRRIRDWEGAEGWVHQSMLVGRRNVVVVGDIRALRKSGEAGAAVVARAEPGVIGGLQRCEREWCEVDLAGYRGWVRRAEVWGVYEHEKFPP
mgnify:CR=1 FL=1